MYYYINKEIKNFVHQVGNQPRLYYDAARSTNHQDSTDMFSKGILSHTFCFQLLRK